MGGCADIPFIENERRRRAGGLERCRRPERAGRFPPAFPHLAACESAIRRMDPDRESARELDALLDGILRRHI